MQETFQVQACRSWGARLSDGSAGAEALQRYQQATSGGVAATDGSVVVPVVLRRFDGTRGVAVGPGLHPLDGGRR